MDSPQGLMSFDCELPHPVSAFRPMLSAPYSVVSTPSSRPVASAHRPVFPDPAIRGADNFSANNDHTPDRGAADIDPTGCEKADTPPFLIGEEVSNEVGLSDGKKIFIDDVLETAEWCVETRCFIFTQNKPFDQGSHTRATKQLSLHSPERVHHRVCRQMGRPCARAFYFHCR